MLFKILAVIATAAFVALCASGAYYFVSKARADDKPVIVEYPPEPPSNSSPFGG